MDGGCLGQLRCKQIAGRPLTNLFIGWELRVSPFLELRRYQNHPKGVSPFLKMMPWLPGNCMEESPKNSVGVEPPS